MAKVQLSSSRPLAQIKVSRQGSSVPPQIYDGLAEAAELGLRAGTLELVAEAQDGKTLTTTLTVSAGETEEYFFDFDQKAAPPENVSQAAPALQSSQPAKSGLAPLQIGGIAAAGLGVGALGGGVALGLLSQKSEDKAKDLCRGQLCPSDAEEEFQKAKTQATIANILFISGGILAATGVTLVVIGGARTDSESAGSEQRPLRTASSLRLELSPTVSAQGGGLMAFGHF